MVHVVYCGGGKPELNRILSGKTTMIARAAKTCMIPHSCVTSGDTLYFAQASGSVTAAATVESVCNEVCLEKNAAVKILKANKNRLALPPEAYTRLRAKYLCLIGFKDARAILPLKLNIRANADGWIIADKLSDIINERHRGTGGDR